MGFPKKFGSPLLFLILWRLISVYTVQTFHVPDEYWQSLEVAHRLAFGYGYLTWEWRERIRSYIYPFLISLMYRLLAVASLDYTIMLTTLPRVCQAALSGYADYRFYSWTRSKWALFSLCTNWFWYYCASRTLANSMETALTIIALSVFPWPDHSRRGSGFLWIVGFLVAVRPTAAILWIPLCIYHICASADTLWNTLKSYILIGVCTITYSTLVDTLCYGTFVITPWEFFKANVLHGVGDFYGTHHAFWYLTVGLPVVLGLQTFIFPIATWSAMRNSIYSRQHTVMIVVICWTVAVYSCLAHKEFRFLLPLLPMFIHVSTRFPLRLRITESRRKFLLLSFVLSNSLPGFYLGLIHQRGTLDVMKILENALIHSNSSRNDVLILTPCHATPLYSHLHIDASVRFLTCEPNLENLPDYTDESDQFFADPSSWLNNNFVNKNITSPELLVIFDNLSTKIAPFLKKYRLLVKIFHSHFPQSNYGEYIMLYRRKL